MSSSPRPALVTWLGLGVLTITAFALARCASALSLPSLPLTVPRSYLVLSGAVWAAVGAMTAFGLVRGARWAPRLTRLSALVLAAWYWADRLLWVRSDYARQAWPAGLALTLAAVLAPFWILGRRSAADYFGERDV